MKNEERCFSAATRDEARIKISHNYFQQKFPLITIASSHRHTHWELTRYRAKVVVSEATERYKTVPF